MPDLVQRLRDLRDKLVMHPLHSAEGDIATLNEAIAVLGKPKVVGTPWTTPLKGDLCRRRDGKSREVAVAKYVSIYGSHANFRETPASGHYPGTVGYVDHNGRPDTVSASSWATWCRNAVRDGGTYERRLGPVSEGES